ncbi:NAD-dependent epimerase/dehydratase family protein [Paenibacillus glycinis]|uniref:NAD-dependent epimerase/dehydratase family protein n=1 Tax=Paenibacillus glycinis TaxID=2697035 RepID=A0ABW9XVJ1_9BACL|nr:NAD(P)-dependent oxidoreductase [Paenibacillus glycinis]NBD26698.1 NAD-dependent epimerase/dehydratase family protein [Paenibacillus glycinis]
MKKALIVGGAGYIGGYMTDLLQQSPEFDITVYDNLLFENYYLKNVKFIYGDIRDRVKLARILPNYDIVIWLAALVGDGACAVNLPLTEEINASAAKWLTDNYDGTIVFMSTCSVYGMNKDLINEDATPNPLSAYASTKLEAEQYIVKHAADYLIFRLGTLYGVGDLFSRLRFDLVVNVLTLHAIQKGEVSVFGGQQWRPILHVKDVAHAVAYCLKHNVRGLYNLSEQNVVIADLAEEIVKIVPNVNIKHQDIKFEDLRDYKVDNNRILATGWRPKFTLTEGIEEIAWAISESRVKDPNAPVYSNVAYMRELERSGVRG